jgi:hypothetical protein
VTTKPIQITINGTLAEVLVDGEPAKNVTGYALEQSAGRVARLRLEVFGLGAVVTGDAEIDAQPSAAAAEYFEELAKWCDSKATKLNDHMNALMRNGDYSAELYERDLGMVRRIAKVLRGGR